MMRNHSLDILKFLCAILVVFLHVNTPYSQYYMPLTRCAVPVFFIISGYLLYIDTDLTDRLGRNIRRIALIGFWATLLFVPIKVINSHGLTFFTPSSIVKWVFFNVNPFGFHLWYLHAYLYALVIIWLCAKCGRLNSLFYITPFLLMADLVFGKYSIMIWGMEFPYVCVRNYLCVGIPYVMIGFLIKKWYGIIYGIKRLRLIAYGGGNCLCLKLLRAQSS